MRLGLYPILDLLGGEGEGLELHSHPEAFYNKERYIAGARVSASHPPSDSGLRIEELAYAMLDLSTHTPSPELERGVKGA